VNSLLLFLVRLLDFYTLIVFFYVVVSWLFHFNILNSQNVFLWKVFESFKKLTDPPLNYIRRYLPNFGGIDISPVLLILLIYLFKDLLIEYWPRGQ
jgi:YggT family protein